MDQKASIYRGTTQLKTKEAVGCQLSAVGPDNSIHHIPTFIVAIFFCVPELLGVGITSNLHLANSDTKQQGLKGVEMGKQLTVEPLLQALT